MVNSHGQSLDQRTRPDAPRVAPGTSRWCSLDPDHSLTPVESQATVANGGGRIRPGDSDTSRRAFRFGGIRAPRRRIRLTNGQPDRLVRRQRRRRRGAVRGRASRPAARLARRPAAGGARCRSRRRGGERPRRGVALVPGLRRGRGRAFAPHADDRKGAPRRADDPVAGGLVARPATHHQDRIGVRRDPAQRGLDARRPVGACARLPQARQPAQAGRPNRPEPAPRPGRGRPRHACGLGRRDPPACPRSRRAGRAVLDCRRPPGPGKRAVDADGRPLAGRRGGRTAPPAPRHPERRAMAILDRATPPARLTTRSAQTRW